MLIHLDDVAMAQAARDTKIDQTDLTAAEEEPLVTNAVLQATK